MSLFERPHRSFSTYDVVLGLKNEALREVDDYTTWVEKVEAELVAVYKDQVAHLTLADIYYATRDAPNTFSSRISDEMFQRLREHKAVLAHIEDVSGQLTEQEKLLQLAEAELAAAEEAGKSVRQPLRTLRAVKAKVTELRREADTLSYERDCLSQQLGNVFKARFMRVSLV
ncbi:hypothetical protein ABL78_7941 [Leptomonas seymouri]|uniref:Uncharacterized protein n=1 Tax=Leptomonas seymouri TaxID=5684 RepID=A0A0N1IHH3_LEPSE|nr:hypothetical protein ABL78_7941 [Leptomonas seymouri]|eukprot:KPI83042.1 hypothetical protein ABL78_7941 [Leptomonas seymouri]